MPEKNSENSPTHALTIEEYSIFSKKYFQKEHSDFVSFIIQELDVNYESRIFYAIAGNNLVIGNFKKLLLLL